MLLPSMQSSLLFSLALVLYFDFVSANTEKIIFLGPPTINLPATQPTLGDLRLDVLTPDDWSRRLDLQASFPDAGSPLGTTTWLLLTNLTQNQRYELRVCWAATVRSSPAFKWRHMFTMDTATHGFLARSLRASRCLGYP